MPDSHLSLDEFVFNTEAHPIPVSRHHADAESQDGGEREPKHVRRLLQQLEEMHNKARAHEAQHRARMEEKARVLAAAAQAEQEAAVQEEAAAAADASTSAAEVAPESASSPAETALVDAVVDPTSDAINPEAPPMAESVPAVAPSSEAVTASEPDQSITVADTIQDGAANTQHQVPQPSEA